MAATGGRDTKKDNESGEGLLREGIIERAKANYEKKRPVAVETLIATDRFVVVNVPYQLCVALGINSATDLTAQITALGVADTVKEFIPAKKENANKDKGRASLKDTDSVSLSQKLIGTRYVISLHTPITYTVGSGADAKQRKRQWYSLRVPQVISIPAFSLFLARFATANRMPPGFTTEKGRRLYRPKDSTEGLTVVDKK
ncbi:MAG: hypothetical protein F6K17_06700 [Okeania sp. SIO3C4]|nr:hypothetical protein [Okeania sp. SIO3B3]NER02341.1 hypothetical protein [Okeania sp. SIO3C4]